MSDAICWQFLVKQSKAHANPSFAPPPTDDPRVAEIPQREAKAFVTEYEWLGNAGAARYCYGLLYGARLAAVVCYARPTATTAFASMLGLHPESVLQLCRGASTHWAPKYAASMLIARSLRMLETRKHPRLVVAYADPEAGEVGVVYQATNAAYLGFTDSRGPGAYIINGAKYHPRSVHRLFGSARHDVLVRIDPHYSRIQRTKKHRYVYVLGSEFDRRRLVKQLSTRFRPYPKRVVRNKDAEVVCGDAAG